MVEQPIANKTLLLLAIHAQRLLAQTAAFVDPLVEALQSEYVQPDKESKVIILLRLVHTVDTVMVAILAHTQARIPMVNMVTAPTSKPAGVELFGHAVGSAAHTVMAICLDKIFTSSTNSATAFRTLGIGPFLQLLFPLP
jgi:hypothetical protein